MSTSRCTYCNAPMVDGAAYCDYCNLSPTGAARPPPPPPSAVKEAASSGGLFLIGLVLVLFRQLWRLIAFLARQLWRLVVWLVPPWSRKTRIALGVIGLACVGVMGFAVVLDATVYSIEMDAPRYSANPLPPGQRPISPIQAAQMVMDLRETPDRTIDQRKQAWREKYEGRWVTWKGTVDTVHPNIGHLRLQSGEDGRIPLEVKFDPIHAPRLEKLQKGQEVRVSGMLWGYSFTLGMPQLSDGALVDELAPGHVQDGPM